MDARVYEGAPTPVTAFFAAAPKVAGIAIFARATVVAFPGITHEWQQIVVFVSIASMALGNFAAIGQRNIKRLMAYSSIGHMGYALVGLAAGTPEGVQGVLVYMSIYVAMTLGTFAAILSMRRDGKLVENISDLSGLARTHPTMAFFLGVLRFCSREFRRSPGSSPNSTCFLPPSRLDCSRSRSLAYSQVS